MREKDTRGRTRTGQRESTPGTHSDFFPVMSLFSAALYKYMVSDGSRDARGSRTEERCPLFPHGLGGVAAGSWGLVLPREAFPHTSGGTCSQASVSRAVSFIRVSVHCYNLEAV